MRLCAPAGVQAPARRECQRHANGEQDVGRVPAGDIVTYHYLRFGAAPSSGGWIINPTSNSNGTNNIREPCDEPFARFHARATYPACSRSSNLLAVYKRLMLLLKGYSAAM